MIRWFKILIGTLCMAMAVNFVYEPMHMVTGGVSGTAIIIKGLSMNWSDFEIPVWMTNILLNIPIFLGDILYGGKDIFVSHLLQICSLHCFYFAFRLFRSDRRIIFSQPYMAEF